MFGEGSGHEEEGGKAQDSRHVNTNTLGSIRFAHNGGTRTTALCAGTGMCKPAKGPSATIVFALALATSLGNATLIPATPSRHHAHQRHNPRYHHATALPYSSSIFEIISLNPVAISQAKTPHPSILQLMRDVNIVGFPV